MSKILSDLNNIYDQVVEDYYKQALLTDKYMMRDHEAVLKIQRMWRRYVIRKRYIRILEAVRCIQRFIRGYLSWKYADSLKAVQVDQRN